MMTSFTAFAHTVLSLGAVSAPPARGAALDQVVIGTIAAMAATSVVIWVAVAHRDGRITWLARLGAFSERVSGLPAWAALPSAVAGGSLVIAVFGFYWDVAKHIDTGRDPGPFGTAAHYPILIGLFGLAMGGFLAIAMGAPKSVPTSIRITSRWHAPLGGVLIFLCGSFALLGFPLDDVWHALFGQDVTLWGPTHILMIGGASLATLGIWVLLVEGQRAAARDRGEARISHPHPVLTRLRTAAIAGGFLLGLSTLQGEFDYGVPQFQLLYHPILLMIAAGAGLVTARIRLGRFGALQAVAFFVLIRGTLTLIIGPVFQMSTMHFPLYVVEALLVEAVALRVPTSKPLTLGAISGVLIGTVGLAAEWGWSHLWMPLPWTSSMLVPAAILGFTAALAAAILGAFIGRALTFGPGQSAQRAPRILLPLAAAALVACIAFPLPMNGGHPIGASVQLTPKTQGTAAATIKLHPADAAHNAQWLTVTAWQGGGLIVDRLRRVSDGVYRTTQPIPIATNWKTMLRIEHGRALDALPIYMPADPAIPAKAIPATASINRPFVRDKKILQREAIGGSWWLATPAYLLLLAIAMGWLISLGRGLRRLESSAPDRRAPSPQPPLSTAHAPA